MKKSDSISNAADPLFSESDISFIHSVFHMELVTHDDLDFIMRHRKLRQPLLDSRRLFEAVHLEKERESRTSRYLFYYVQVRQILLRSDLTDPDLADYLTLVLVELAESEIQRRKDNGSDAFGHPEMSMAALTREVEDDCEINIQARIGPYTMMVNGSVDTGIEFGEFHGG